MSITDPQPTCYDLKPVVLTVEPQAPSITDVELAALRGVDIAENLAEPINRFSVARGVIKLSAYVARRFR
tara:strand:- start:5971 stop:6180 length:210 start_codon:yes stop_codon:yes gene_type:complete